MKPVRLGRVAGLEVSFAPSALLGSGFLWAVFGGLAAVFFHAGAAEAIAGGLVMTLLHWLDEFLHNLGHATAARAVGHPMTGVQFYLVIGLSQYPRDEVGVTPAMHIRRALGGPAGSSIVTVVTGLIALGTVLTATPAAWVAVLWFLDNLLVFTLGAFLPLGFSDGSTILRWARRRG